MNTKSVLNSILQVLLILTYANISFAEYGFSCNIDLDLDCQPPSNYSDIVLNGKSWNNGTFSERTALYTATDVQNSVDGCQLFALMLKTECGVGDPVSVVFKETVNSPLVTSVVDGFDTHIICKAEVTNAFKNYFGVQTNSSGYVVESANTKLIANSCPKSKKIFPSRFLMNIINMTLGL